VFVEKIIERTGKNQSGPDFSGKSTIPKKQHQLDDYKKKSDGLCSRDYDKRLVSNISGST